MGGCGFVLPSVTDTNLPAAEAHFISSQMHVVIFEDLVSNFTEEALQECPCGVRYWVDRTIGPAHWQEEIRQDKRVAQKCPQSILVEMA